MPPVTSTLKAQNTVPYSHHASNKHILTFGQSWDRVNGSEGRVNAFDGGTRHAYESKEVKHFSFILRVPGNCIHCFTHSLTFSRLTASTIEEQFVRRQAGTKGLGTQPAHSPSAFRQAVWQKQGHRSRGRGTYTPQDDVIELFCPQKQTSIWQL